MTTDKVDRIIRTIREKLEHGETLKTGAVLEIDTIHDPAWIRIKIEVRPKVETSWDALFANMDEEKDPGPQGEDDPRFLGEDDGEVRVQGLEE